MLWAFHVCSSAVALKMNSNVCCSMTRKCLLYPRYTRSKEHQAVKTLMLIYMHSRNVDMKCILWLTNIWIIIIFNVALKCWILYFSSCCIRSQQKQQDRNDRMTLTQQVVFMFVSPRNKSEFALTHPFFSPPTSKCTPSFILLQSCLSSFPLSLPPSLLILIWCTNNQLSKSISEPITITSN